MSTMTRIVCLVIISVTTMGFVPGISEAAVVGLWRFNEPSGDVTDSSGNGNTGAFVGPNANRVASMSGFGTAGEFLKVVEEDDLESASYVEVPPHYSLQVGLEAGDPWTLAAWAYEYSDGFGFLDSEYGTVLHYRRTLTDQFPYPTPDYGLTLQSGAPGDTQYYLWHGRPDDDSNPFRLGTSVDAEIKVESWVHLAMVYDGSDVIFYTDGSEQFRTTVGAHDVRYPGYTGALQIGSAPGFTATRNFNGKLDDVAVFNEALSPSEIATIMTGDFSQFIEPLPQPEFADWQRDNFGLWNQASSWQPYVAPDSPLITPRFTDATDGPTTVVNEQAVTVKGLHFEHTQPYAIAGTGSITIDSDGAGNGSISVLNTGGNVTHEIQLPVLLASDTDVAVDGGTVLELDHRLELNGNTLNVTGAGRLNVNNDGAIGTTGTLSNSGTVGGAGRIGGDFINTSSGTLAVELFGSGPLGAQGLSVAGHASLDGALQIQLLNGFVPANGSMFTVLSASSISDNGLMLAGDMSNFSYSIVGGTSLVLTYGTPSLSGDYNQDGTVDAADYVVWRRTDGTPAGYAAWRSNFGASLGSGGNSVAVPEPSAWILSACASSFVFGRRRRNRSHRNARVPSLARCCGLLLAVAGLAGLARTASGTVLIFSGEYGGAGPAPGSYTAWKNEYSIIDEYGDRVASLTQHDVASNDFGGTDWYNLFYDEQGEGFTPNVVVDYPASNTGVSPPSIYRYWTPYGSFTDAVYPVDDGLEGGEFYMTFTADAGVSVKLDALELSRNVTSAPEFVTIRVHQGNDPLNLGTQLYSSGATNVAAGATQVFAPNVSADALTLVYEFAGNGVDQIWDWAIDNVKFSQTGGGVPTTATWNHTGTGLWSAPGNWSPDVSPLLVPNGNDRTAILSNSTSGPSTIVLDQDITIKTLRFDHTASYVVGGAADLTLESNSGSASIDVLNAGSPVTHEITAEVHLGSDTTSLIAPGVTLEINNRLNLNEFNFSKSGSGELKINNLVTSSGGMISGTGGVISGSGSIAADLVNDGATVAPGNSPGTLSVAGNYHQTSAGVLQMEIGGHGRGSEYDVLAIGGDALIQGGRLEVVLLDGFQPVAGDHFDILDFASFHGSFDTVAFPLGVRWDLSRLHIDGTISVAQVVPEPASALLASLAAFLLAAVQRSRRCSKRVCLVVQ